MPNKKQRPDSTGEIIKLSTIIDRNIARNLKNTPYKKTLDRKTGKIKETYLTPEKLQKSKKAQKWYEERFLKDRTITTVQGKTKTIKSQTSEAINRAQRSGNIIEADDQAQKDYGIFYEPPQPKTLKVASGWHVDANEESRGVIEDLKTNAQFLIYAFEITDDGGANFVYKSEADFYNRLNEVNGSDPYLSIVFNYVDTAGYISAHVSNFKF